MTELETPLMLKTQLDNMVLAELLLKLAVKFTKQVKNLTSKTFTNYRISLKPNCRRPMTQTTTKSKR